MFVNEKIDWLSVTFPQDTKLKNLVRFLPENILSRIKSPIPVYSHAYEYCGVKFLLGHPNSGIHMIISGKPLDNLRLVYGYTLDAVHKMIAENNGKPSRIDIALDIRGNEQFTVNEVYKQHLTGNCKTRLKGSKFIGENEKIQTLYIGNVKSKNRKIRVYNKGLEDGNDIPNWIRVEYEKRRGALSTYRALVSGQRIAAIIKSACDFPKWKLWQEIIGSSKAIIPRESLSLENDLQSKIDWILNSCAPAIAKVAYEQYRNKECFDIHDAPIFEALASSIGATLREKLYEYEYDDKRIG